MGGSTSTQGSPGSDRSRMLQGMLGQMANPQQKDPNQNRNLGGFPRGSGPQLSNMLGPGHGPQSSSMAGNGSMNKIGSARDGMNIRPEDGGGGGGAAPGTRFYNPSSPWGQGGGAAGGKNPIRQATPGSNIVPSQQQGLPPQLGGVSNSGFQQTGTNRPAPGFQDFWDPNAWNEANAANYAGGADRQGARQAARQDARQQWRAAGGLDRQAAPVPQPGRQEPNLGSGPTPGGSAGK